MKKNIIFINSHPIQYFAPLYKYMNKSGMKTDCWYCSEAYVQGGMDKEFGVEIKWDLPMLDGYDYKFFKNHSWKPSEANGFFGLMNPGMIRELFRVPKSVIVVHGWHYFTLFFILMLGKFAGHTVCLRCDVPHDHEALKSGWKQRLKRGLFRYLLFPRINFFLYVGEQNKKFYTSCGVSSGRLLSCPYAVDNERFQAEASLFSKQVAAIKKELCIPAPAKVIVFSAKYIPKKRPLDLLKAFGSLTDERLHLIMVGEGGLRPQMERLIKEEGIKNVMLTGFVNQSKISEYYAISDLFVMCSGQGEHWGLSVNEAMNFNLPLLLSDLSGCAEDLVKQGRNGYTFTTGDVQDLSAKLKKILWGNTLTKTPSSLEIVQQYSYASIVQNMQVLV